MAYLTGTEAGQKKLSHLRAEMEKFRQDYPPTEGFCGYKSMEEVTIVNLTNTIDELLDEIEEKKDG